MEEKIPVNLKYRNQTTHVNDHLLPTTKADLVEETDVKQFISARQKAKIDEKQDRLGYVPINKEGDTMTGPLILSSDTILTAKQAATKEYVDHAISELVGNSPAALDTLYELAEAINNDPEFAVSLSSMVGLKVDKSDTTAGAEPNKIPYLNSEGSLSANAASASKLKRAFILSLSGDITYQAVSVNGENDVALDIQIPQLSDSEITDIFYST